MKKNNIIIKSVSIYLLIWCLFSVTFAATTQKWRDIIDELQDNWRTDEEIRKAITDLWYNANEYLWKSENSNITIIPNNNSNSDSSSPSTYISRSCKPYDIEYVQSLNAYTSPDLLKKEYFINIDYLIRYIDSKNANSAECYRDSWRISSSYTDNYTWTDRYTAPNWKIYFIKEQNWLYTSSELSSPKDFATIDELKNYIKERNPLISMWWIVGSNNQDAVTYLWNELSKS